MPDDVKIEQHGVTVTICRSEQDGAPVVFVDTDEALEGARGPVIRVRLNDYLIHSGTGHKN